MSNKKKAALIRGQARTSEIERKVLEVMDIIISEIDCNSGVYPYNGGSVSKNEVSRRAEIGKTTLFSAKQTSLNEIVNNWLEALKNKRVVKRTLILRGHAERAKAWKAQYLSLAASHHKTELDLLAAQSELEVALVQLAKLQSEKEILLAQLKKAGSNITPLKIK
jgi:hypothetical protein